MNLNERHIAHLDLDSFYVSVECLRNPRLNGKPVIVGGNANRGIVAACSYEARKFGIYQTMPMKHARILCPDAIIVRGDKEVYSKYSRLVREIMEDCTPLFEQGSISEFYLDLSGMEKFFGCGKFTTELKSKIVMESGLPVSFALASNKLVSKIATDISMPNGQVQVPFGLEKAFLAPLSIIRIPGIGEKTASLLNDMGVRTVKVLSEIPVDHLKNLLGKPGMELSKKANGIDETPVIPFKEQKTISTEETFQTDTIDINFLNSRLLRMTEKIGFELRNQNRLTGCVIVKLTYSNMQTFTKQSVIPYTNADSILFTTAKFLFSKLYERRMLIRTLGVSFNHLIPGNLQISLFDDTQEMVNLNIAIDSVKHRFGEKFLVRAAGLL